MRLPSLAVPKSLRYGALVFVVLVTCVAPARAAGPAGSVVGLVGACIVESGGNRKPLALGQAVQVGDTVEVPTDGKLRLRMSDGSMISAAPGTRVTITTYTTDTKGQREDAQLGLTQGLLRAVVTPVTGSPARFEVDTALGTAAVRSTDWFVEAAGTSMDVAVLTGSIEFASTASKHSVTVAAGRGSRIDGSQDPTAPRVWRSDEFDALIVRTRLPQAAAPVKRPPVQPRPKQSHSDDQGPYSPGPGPAPSPAPYNPPPYQEPSYPPGGYAPAPYPPGGYSAPYPASPYPPRWPVYPGGPGRGYEPTPYNPGGRSNSYSPDSPSRGNYPTGR